MLAIFADLLVCLFAAARSAIVVAGTPPSLWLVENPSFIQPAIEVPPGVLAAAQSFETAIADPAFLRSTQRPCFDGAEGELSGNACLREIDRALRAAPASAELWYFKASMLAAHGSFGEALLDALGNSYRTAKREAWLSANRVVLGLTLYPILGEELRREVDAELALIAGSPEFLRPLAAEYVANPSLRQSAAASLRSLPPAELENFTTEVRIAMKAGSTGDTR